MVTVLMKRFAVRILHVSPRREIYPLFTRQNYPFEIGASDLTCNLLLPMLAIRLNQLLDFLIYLETATQLLLLEKFFFFL